MVEPIPSEYSRLSPYLAVDGADDAIAFYCDVLGFERRGDVMRSPDGRIGHAEIVLGDSVVMLADEWPEAGNVGPATIGGTPVMLHIYVEDVDAVHAAAVAAGAETVREPEDQFYGDRLAVFLDPWGHKWSVATHLEDVPPEEMGRRAAEAMGG
ncbi:MAG: VOC family protein [Acidimicrobiales bacterium]|nr:VOC family protein [Acidimicrobiales bacterium]HRW38267.1 VOC family protein [Aquihabitans sp.]